MIGLVPQLGIIKHTPYVLMSKKLTYILSVFVGVVSPSAVWYTSLLCFCSYFLQCVVFFMNLVYLEGAEVTSEHAVRSTRNDGLRRHVSKKTRFMKKLKQT